MRMTIRRKLVLFILLPTVAIFALVGGFMLQRLGARLEDQAREEAAARARHYAALLDGRFETVAQIASVSVVVSAGS